MYNLHHVPLSANPSRGSHRGAPFASTNRLHRSHAISLLVEAELTWLEEDEEDDGTKARDEEEKDTMTKAKDGPDVEDASSSACFVTSEGRKA